MLLYDSGQAVYLELKEAVDRLEKVSCIGSAKL